MAKKPTTASAQDETDATAEAPATTPAALDDGKIAYDITDKAPPRIALQRIEKGQTEIRLTEEQARAELLAGHIRPKPAAEAPASDAV
ncbi:hypothetical protein P7F60_28975 [Rhizobium sp. YJ-22]|uniref:hypothetical protein n=1 Tax=Rhizobium sp. YJ-22 TaxID=3037556 RepID=UPI0024125CC8|nr:hypothetical protein [Rhizobium sp. YJ-22]MDG3580417.1 hypothetical protein [Rhizobium sp. YJ-22]